MFFFGFLTMLRSALEVENLDYSLGQHHKQRSEKSELPDLTQGTPPFRRQGYWTNIEGDLTQSFTGHDMTYYDYCC